MESYRNPKFVERLEDVIFELETPLNAVVPNNGHQKKDGYRFVDNSGEVTPFDWYNARLGISLKVDKLADGGNIAGNDHNGIVNSIHSFIKNFDIKLNGKKVYDCNDANHCVNIKSLLEYSPGYAQSTATNEFFHLDTTRSAEERQAQANYNKGFAASKLLLGASDVVTRELPLNRYSFFEALEKNLLPSGRLELNIEFESDANLIWKTADDDCRVVLTKLQLIVPRITFNSEGQSIYMSKFLKLYKWSYLRENIERSNSTQQRAGHFKISSGISKPRHVFVFIINDNNIDSQTANPFLYNTFSVVDNKTLNNCHLEVGNGQEYPEIHYTPSTDLSRVYRDVLKYVHKNSEYSEGSLLNISNFQTLFPFLYFDLTKQKADIRDGTTKLTFRYELSAGTNAAYSVYALTLFEQEAELIQQNGKLLFR